MGLSCSRGVAIPRSPLRTVVSFVLSHWLTATANDERYIEETQTASVTVA
jgi:hypothetical protein